MPVYTDMAPPYLDATPGAWQVWQDWCLDQAVAATGKGRSFWRDKAVRAAQIVAALRRRDRLVLVGMCPHTMNGEVVARFGHAHYYHLTDLANQRYRNWLVFPLLPGRAVPEVAQRLRWWTAGYACRTFGWYGTQANGFLARPGDFPGISTNLAWRFYNVLTARLAKPGRLELRRQVLEMFG
jgi:hypothetical protein